MMRNSKIQIGNYQKGGKKIDDGIGEIAYATIPQGISSNGYPVRVEGDILYAYVVGEKGEPLKEAPDGDDIGYVTAFVI